MPISVWDGGQLQGLGGKGPKVPKTLHCRSRWQGTESAQNLTLSAIRGERRRDVVALQNSVVVACYTDDAKFGNEHSWTSLFWFVFK